MSFWKSHTKEIMSTLSQWNPRLITRWICDPGDFSSITGGLSMCLLGSKQALSETRGGLCWKNWLWWVQPQIYKLLLISGPFGLHCQQWLQLQLRKNLIFTILKEWAGALSVEPAESLPKPACACPGNWGALPREVRHPQEVSRASSVPVGLWISGKGCGRAVGVGWGWHLPLWVRQLRGGLHIYILWLLQMIIEDVALTLPLAD